MIAFAATSFASRRAAFRAGHSLGRASGSLLLAIALLTLCSCRAAAPRSGGPLPQGPSTLPQDAMAQNGPVRPNARKSKSGVVQASAVMPAGAMSMRGPMPPQNPMVPPTLPPEAFIGGPADRTPVPAYIVPQAPTAAMGLPLPDHLTFPWAPPGIALPWPRDEYLHDGGEKLPVTVNRDGQVNGLELEDTIVHYDTLDGRTLVEPSNKVCIYAPRFAAVRHVEEVVQSLQRDKVIEVELPVSVEQNDERLLAGSTMQPVQPLGDVGIKEPSIARLNQAEAAFSNRLGPAGFQSRFKAYEDFEEIRLGSFDDAEKARLAESITAAITWTHDQAVQVILDNVKAVVETGDQRAQATYRAEIPTNPRLRVCKVASTKQAKPGDFVEFTIRFDNVGDAAIGNVTLIDNLTTRLEYVDGSAKASREADFFTSPNEGDSLVLRWEFAEPLDPGHGGLVRFKCRVR
jgi:uncharacterized repeat protein (TIGR01451 family)